MTESQTYDAVVIGAGVFGAWTAYRLARGGARVLLADAYGAANSRASSAGESRIIRMGYGADEIYTKASASPPTLWPLSRKLAWRTKNSRAPKSRSAFRKSLATIWILAFMSR